ncbi:MAG TPA: hypothetical protein VGE98_03350, partial [Thermoanaerobaculia bacterium]
NGFARDLEAPVAVALDVAQPAPAAGAFRKLAHSLVWGGEVRVDSAYRLRLHLADVHLPAGTRLWIYGEDGLAVAFGPELRAGAVALWTPSVGGPAARLEVEVPDSAGAPARVSVDSVAEIVAPQLDLAAIAAPEILACRVDSSCVAPSQFPVATYRKAIAHLEFFEGRSGFVCTGGLINDSDPRTLVPYLLTAHHCINTTDVAASLESFFDLFNNKCQGTAPALSQLPRVNGSSLLATGAGSDFTLLLLPRLPTGRTLLGWSAAPVADGTLLHRLSIPYDTDVHAPIPEVYSETRVDAIFPACTDAPHTFFLYSDSVTGGVSGGSSGSPVLLGDGRIVGQLLGGCGTSTDTCGAGPATTDGAFATTYASVRAFLDPLKPCAPAADTLCLLGKRFKVQVAWDNQFDGSSGIGRPLPRTDSTGFFYFSDPSNTELVVKMLDFGSVVKLFYGELTNLHFTITVTDTRDGTMHSYRNTAGDCGGLDNNAFPGLGKRALASTGGCVPGKQELCLAGRRFAVDVTWQNPAGAAGSQAGSGNALALSDTSGLFSFTDPTNVELVTKVVVFPDRVAFFYGALSNLQYTIRLTDTSTGAVKTYTNPAGTLCGGLDNHAF